MERTCQFFKKPWSIKGVYHTEWLSSFENLVIWAHVTAKKVRKCSLGYTQEKEDMNFNLCINL